ncbi:hypothetical protein V490_01208 [Pseudogymnoascus sp. VKM F-3557]|nr:hypothetical protein V490_01208 [Pseudogymnoascus sp. VKM F-3557]
MQPYSYPSSTLPQGSSISSPADSSSALQLINFRLNPFHIPSLLLPSATPTMLRSIEQRQFKHSKLPSDQISRYLASILFLAQADCEIGRVDLNIEKAGDMIGQNGLTGFQMAEIWGPEGFRGGDVAATQFLRSD